ncbi:MAG: DNA replication/repair protein RecF [Thermoanaerobaculaceae bacterium]
MIISRLRARGFRNLADQELQLEAGLTLLGGPNGAGKSNLLEAVTVLGNLSSFRPTSPAQLVCWGQEGYALGGVVQRAGAEVEVRQDARLGRYLARSLWRGARRLAMGEYLQLCPVAPLSGYDRALVVGVPEDRRRFLDRLVFHLHPEALRLLQQYRRALRQRSELLASGGGDDATEAFEEVLASSGARLIDLRLLALRLLGDRLEVELEELGWPTVRPQVRYHAPDGLGGPDATQLGARIRSALARMRRVDAQQRRTSVGPHRHDLAISVGGAPAREALSAGQAKLLAVALRLAALAVLEQRLGSSPVVVFDDVDAELDASTLGRVLARLTGRAQVLISSARPEIVLPVVKGGAVWWVESGRVKTGGAERSLP